MDAGSPFLNLPLRSEAEVLAERTEQVSAGAAFAGSNHQQATASSDAGDAAVPVVMKAEGQGGETSTEILALARSIERQRLEAGSERLHSQRGADFRRWEALMNGAAPAGWAVDAAKAEAAKPKARTAVRVTVTEGSRVCMDKEPMDLLEVFEDFHLGGAEQLRVQFAINDGREIMLELAGTCRLVKIEPYAVAP